jgi:hypothetical protein
MALDFPNSPALNQTYTSGGQTWIWDGVAWTLSTTTISGLVNGAAGQIPYQSGVSTTAFVPTGPTGSALTANGVNAPTWTPQSSLAVGSATSATTATNLASGGVGQVPYQSGAGATSFVPTGPTGAALTANGSAAPAWTAQSSLSVGSATNATNLTTGTIGQVPYQSGTGTTSFVPTGPTGAFLSANGSAAPTWSNPACVLLSNTTVGAVSTVTISNVFSASYRSYKIVYSLVSNAATAANVNFLLRSGASNVATGYYNRLWYSDGTTPATGNQNNVASCDWAMYHANLIAAGWIELVNPYAAAGKIWTWQGGAFGGSTNVSYQGMAYNGSTSLCDGISLTSVGAGAAWTGGTIKIYGFRES